MRMDIDMSRVKSIRRYTH